MPYEHPEPTPWNGDDTREDHTERPRQFRWGHPADWLLDQIDATTDPAELQGMLRSIVTVLDGDQIQDVFQSEMDAAGYFEPLEGE